MLIDWHLTLSQISKPGGKVSIRKCGLRDRDFSPWTSPQVDQLIRR